MVVCRDGDGGGGGGGVVEVVVNTSGHLCRVPGQVQSAQSQGKCKCRG